MSDLTEILRKRYPLPDDDKFTRVIIADESCYECGGTIYSFRVGTDPGVNIYFGRFFEVPNEWVERWQLLEEAYEDARDELMEELGKVYNLPAGQNRIEPPE